MKSHKFEELNGMDAELRELAMGLKENKTADNQPPAAFTNQLRGQLLQTYEEKPMGWERIWQWGRTAVGFAVLAAVALAGWLLFAQANNFAVGGSTIIEISRSSKEDTKATLVDSFSGIHWGWIKLLRYDFDHKSYAPGETVVLTVDWQLIAEIDKSMSASVSLFKGIPVASANVLLGGPDHPTNVWQVSERVTSVFSLTLPVHVASGEYEIGIRIYDPNQKLISFRDLRYLHITLDHLIVESKEDFIPAQEIITVNAETGEYDVIEVSHAAPMPGIILSDSITFEVHLFYDLESQPEAIVTVKIVEQLEDGAGRGVATGTAVIQQGEGLLTLEIPLNPAQELNSSANLGLLVQMQADEQSAPFFVDILAGYEWQYEP